MNYVKDFLNWTKLKTKIDSDTSIYEISDVNPVPEIIRSGEIRWAILGVNVGREMDGKGANFARPVLVLHSIGSSLAFVIPLTSKNKELPGYLNFAWGENNEHKDSMCLHQIRIISTKRILKRIGKISDNKLISVKHKIKQFHELSKKEKDINSYVGTKAMIKNSRNEILIVKESMTGDWELPGGKIQKTEVDLTREECLQRELEEELGKNFKVKIGILTDTMFRKFATPRNPDIEQVFLVVYECEYVSGEIEKQDEEVLDVAWVGKNNYENYTYVNGYKPVLDKYFANQ